MAIQSLYQQNNKGETNARSVFCSALDGIERKRKRKSYLGAQCKAEEPHPNPHKYTYFFSCWLGPFDHDGTAAGLRSVWIVSQKGQTGFHGINWSRRFTGFRFIWFIHLKSWHTPLHASKCPPSYVLLPHWLALNWLLFTPSSLFRFSDNRPLKIQLNTLHILQEICLHGFMTTAQFSCCPVNEFDLISQLKRL